MKIREALLLLVIVFQFHLAFGQQSILNATPGLQSPGDTIQTNSLFSALPSLSLLPSWRVSESYNQQAILAASPIPKAYSYEKLGAFCKWEVQLEKAARMPVKFRLGEVQYVERMEGKLPDY